MEATKKTATTRAALLVVAALSMLLSGLFIATASQSDATPPPACPDGFNLTADGKNCFQNAVVTRADNPNSCAEGQLTPDGKSCYIYARVLPQEGKTVCPTGYTPDDSLQGMCSRFEPASQHPPTCPTGASGTAGSCYIRVALGPAGAGVCPTTAPAGSVVAGGQCVITGAAPTASTGTCPVSDVVKFENGVCYRVITPAPNVPVACVAGYQMLGGLCKFSNPNIPAWQANPTPATQAAMTSWTCAQVPVPAASRTGAVVPLIVTHGTVTKTASCDYTPAPGPTVCTTAADIGLVSGQCRQSVAIVPGALVCTTGFANVGGKCVRYVPVVIPAASCPIGSVPNATTGTPTECRKPVADAAGVYYCKNAAAALNGKSCVYTTGFLISPAPNLYKCDKGVRTVIGQSSATKVICILGAADANVTEGPSCLQGVLSTDNLYCIVPRIDTAPAAAAAPVPSFTG